MFKINSKARIFFCAVTAMVSTLVFSAGEELPVNEWIAKDGVWGEASNWSLGHVPTENEKAFFPNLEEDITITFTGKEKCGLIYLDYRNDKPDYKTVTFTGPGSLDCMYKTGEVNYIRTKRRLVLDGMTMNLARTLFNYGGISLKNNGRYVCSGDTYLWVANSHITVTNGYFSTSDIFVNAKSTSVTLEKGGTLDANIYFNDGKEDVANVKFTINDGLFTGSLKLGSDAKVVMNGGSASGSITLSSGASLTMNGGVWTVHNNLSYYVADSVELNLNGGKIISAGSNRLTSERWLAGGSGFSFEHLQVNSRAALFSTNDFDTVGITSTLIVTNGGIATSNATRYVGSGTIVARNFAIISGGDPYLKVPVLILGNAHNYDGNVFDTWSQNRYYSLEGPMHIGAWSDWTVRRPTDSGTAALRLTGDFTVDTSDYFDRTTGREIVFDRVNVCGGTTMYVKGCGKLSMRFDKNSTPLDVLRIGSGTVFDPSFEFGTLGTRGPVSARNAIFEKNASLSLTAGRGWLQFETVSVEEPVSLNIAIPEDLPEGWYPVVQGKLGGVLPASLVASATLSGGEGWSIVEREGTLFVKKTALAVTGTYDHEWTGGAGTDSWADDANWVCNVAPMWAKWPRANGKDFIPCFGAYGSGVVWYDSDRDAATQFRWLSSADSFTIKSRNVNGTANANRFMTVDNNNVKQSSGLYSEASTPQFIDIPIRVANRMTWCAAGRGALVQRNYFYPKNDSAKSFSVQGDVRYQCDKADKPVWAISLLDPYLKAPYTKFTVMNGSKLVISKQDGCIDKECDTSLVPSPSSAIHVEDGALLTFAKSDVSFYQWKRKPADMIVDGVLAVECPFLGGVDQTYRGEGILKIDNAKASVSPSRVKIGGSVTLESPSWKTKENDGTYLALSAEGSPTLKATADFVYGPASGGASEERALLLERNASLTVDGGGHAVAFADPVGGAGSVTAKKGTFSFNGGITGDVTLIVDSTAELSLTSALSAKSIVFVPGATIDIGEGGTLRIASGDIDLTDVKLSCDGEGLDSWYPLVTVVNGNISGTFAGGEKYKTKLESDPEGKTLYVKYLRGLSILIK